MSETTTYLPDLLELVRGLYPDWNSFDHPQFVEDEITYKRKAAAFAQAQLDRAALQALLDAGDFAGFIARLKSVANKTNLLYQGVPRKGDLAVLNQPDVDPGPICRAVFDLLHGEGTSEGRLDGFLAFVAANGLPQKWAFPTFYLWLLDPAREIFIKPSAAEWFCKHTGAAAWNSTPNTTTYVAIRNAFHDLLDELRPFGATDLIDVQSFVYVASQQATAFAAAVARLREGLGRLPEITDLAAMTDDRDQVYATYGVPDGIFAPDNLARLTAEDFQSFLRFENNRHWTGISRYGSRVAAHMDQLRAELHVLLDEERPLAARYDEATGRVSGLGRATATPILHVVYPDRYGVWNTKSEAGLVALRVFPTVPRNASEGERYAAVNDVLQRLAAALKIDLWTLDTLWEWLSRQDGPPDKVLAPPFDAVFADREQAEWAFDLFRETVERLGGGPNDERFALTMPKERNMIRLNMGNWAILSIALQGTECLLTLLVEPMEACFSFNRSDIFRDTEEPYAIFTIPVDVIHEWPDDLRTIYERSMDGIGAIFRDWARSNLRSSHVDSVFQALFDEAKRERLLAEGLPVTPSITRYWRITLPEDARVDDNIHNLWADCLTRGIAVVDFGGNLQDPQVKKFMSINPGDRVVAFLRHKKIGGIGTVTWPADEQLVVEQPADRDFFHGHFWIRVGVDWNAAEINVEDLSPATQNKFGQMTVVELTREEFEEVERLISTPAIAKAFRGFTVDAFAFLRDLQAYNNKAWMDVNEERWIAAVREPMRDLISDLGPHLKQRFDPYLAPEELEIEPKFGRTLATIKKRWPDAAGPYHDYYWGAFYRAHLTKQTDAQLFINILVGFFRFGLFFGDRAKPVRDRLRQRVNDDPETFLELAKTLDLTRDFVFTRIHDEVERRDIAISSADDLRHWVDTDSFEMLQELSAEGVVALGPALADRVFDAFRRVFSVYLWAVADDPAPLVERYLAAEFPTDDEDTEPPPLPYTRVDFLGDTHLTADTADELLEVLQEKKQLIFYGPPGTGKTYVARHLARLLTGLADPPSERLTVVQFHPAYGYEDFIEGIRPESRAYDDGRHVVDYPVRDGIFKRFCLHAGQLGGAPCVLIIDEINRGNLPRILGELFYLLEYRDEPVRLPYSDERFRIPHNVHLIGTMNTADRSIALVDFALRRRFQFFHFAADPDLFGRWLQAHPGAPPYLEPLYRALAIEAIDEPDFRIGPSHFMRPGLTEAALARVWRLNIEPALQEYFLDQPDKVAPWRWDGERVRAIREGYAG